MTAMAISFADLHTYVWSSKYTDGNNILKSNFVLPESISFFLENIKNKAISFSHVTQTDKK
jgi:hypothetical protein